MGLLRLAIGSYRNNTDVRTRERLAFAKALRVKLADLSRAVVTILDRSLVGA